MRTNKKLFFYRIRYDLLSLLSVMIVIALSGILFTVNDHFTRWTSFQRIELSLLIISLTSAVIHFFLRKIKNYMYKKKILAVFALVLIALVLISSLFISGVGPFIGKSSEYKYGYSIEECKEDGYHCLNYQFFGFGQCNECRKLIVNETDKI